MQRSLELFFLLDDIITPPSVKMSDRRYFFGKDICRSVPFVAKEWVSAVNYPKLKVDYIIY